MLGEKDEAAQRRYDREHGVVPITDAEVEATIARANDSDVLAMNRTLNYTWFAGSCPSSADDGCADAYAPPSEMAYLDSDSAGAADDTAGARVRATGGCADGQICPS